MDNAGADSLEDPPRHIERYSRIVQPRGPRILVEGPHHASGLADHAPDPVVQHCFGVGQVVQKKPHGPLPRRVTPGQLVVIQVKVRQRAVTGGFESLDNVHSASSTNFPVMLTSGTDDRFLSSVAPRLDRPRKTMV